VKFLSSFLFAVNTWEICGILSVLLTLLGTYLWWHLQTHRSDVEEAAKDGEISGDQARGKIRLIEVRAIACICSGMFLMLLSAVKLMS
jgi:hypothetical protein